MKKTILVVCAISLVWVAPLLAQDASETCKGCHAERATALAATSMGKLSCQTCHGEGAKHIEAAGDKSNPGFATIINPTTAAPEKVNASCIQCHKDGRMFWKTGIHANKKLSCASCHKIHPKDPTKINKALLIKPSETETCFVCHKDKVALVRRSSHMPVKEGKLVCATCHNPHGTAAPKNIKAATTNELCYKCHTEKRGPYLWEHPPVRDNCLNCHDAHGSQHDKMLIAKRPFLICQRCHITTRHPSTLYDNTQIGLQNNRIFNRACLNCHSTIHGSNHPSGKTYLR